MQVRQCRDKGISNDSRILTEENPVRLQYEYSTWVQFRPSIGRHTVLLRCMPAAEDFQQIRQESFSISDEAGGSRCTFWHKEGKDGFGNRVITAGTDERHDTLTYTSRGVVESSTYCIPDAQPHPMFSLPSSLTVPDREMRTLLPRLTGQVLEDCLNITHCVHRHIVYTPGSTHVLTRAADAYRLRKGVCQDYAHLMLSLCHLAGYPARYVCGLMVGEGATHAWVEVHDGYCWYAFDPTNDTAIASGYIKLAHGRDASDCPVSRGTYVGASQEEMKIYVNVKKLIV